MKRLLIPLIGALAVCQLAHADLKIPSSVFKMDELDEAKQKAQEDNEPLIFVYTDPKTS